MVSAGSLGLVLFLAVISLSMQSFAFQQKASYHDLEDAPFVPPIEQSDPSQLFEFLPYNEEPNKCKKKENFADVYKLLKRLQQNDEDSNFISKPDQFNDILDLNDDKNSYDGIPLKSQVYPKLHNIREGKVLAKVVIILELPAPVSTKCKKAFSKLIKFTRGTFESMAHNSECSSQNPTPFDFTFEKITKKPKYPDISNLEVESTTQLYPGNSLEDAEGSGQDDNDFNNFSTRTERVPTLLDNIFEKIIHQNELADNPKISILNSNSLSNVEFDTRYPGENLDHKAILGVDNLHNPVLESETKPHKIINGKIFSILENGNYKDDFLHNLQVEPDSNTQNNVLSLIENLLEHKNKAHHLKPEPSYEELLSVLHDFDTKDHLKGVTTKKPYPFNELEIPNYKPVQNAQTDIFSMSQNSEPYDNILNENVQPSYENIISVLHDYDTKNNIKDVAAKKPYMFNELEIPNYKAVQNAKTDIFSMLQNNEAYDDVLNKNLQLSPTSDLESFERINNINLNQNLQLQDNPSGFIKNKSPLTNKVTPGSHLKRLLSPEYEVITPVNEINPKNNVLSLLEQATLLANKLQNKKHNFQSPYNELNDKFKDNQYPNYYYNHVIPQLGQNDNHEHNGLYDSNSHQVYNLPANYQSLHNFAPNNYGYQKAFGIQDGNNPYKVIAKPNQAGEIELTYILKKPKPVIQTKTYYVKYRIPYQNYIQNLKKEEKLKKSPNEFHRDLIGLSRPIDFSPDLGLYQTNEITNLVASDGNLVTAAVRDGGTTKKVINLKDVKDLKTLLAQITEHEIEFPDISFEDSSVKDAISDFLVTYNNSRNAGLNESSIDEYREKISNINDDNSSLGSELDTT